MESEDLLNFTETLVPQSICNLEQHILMACDSRRPTSSWWWQTIHVSQHTWRITTIRQIRFPVFNSFPPSAAYMRRWTGPSLVQVMACRLFGAKPLPEPKLANFQLDSWEQISVKFLLKFHHFYLRKCIWMCRLPKWRPFWPGGDELT